MKKISVVSLFALLFSLAASANESVHHETAQEAHQHKETGFYAALKGLVTLGGKVDHGEATLDGESGKGLGLEIGYLLGHGFAIEADGTFARNSVTEVSCGEGAEGECESNKGTGEYTTVSLDLVYLYHLTHHLGTFVKAGYEYETENIDQLEIRGNDTGFIYAAGAEYSVSNHVAFMLEYEGTTIDGPRGNSLFAGVLYAF